MKRRLCLLAAIAFASALVAWPAHLHGQQLVQPVDHSHHAEPAAAPASAVPATQVTPGAKLDDLVTKMNAAKGAAKTDAIAELLTALVQEHQACAPMMQQMTKMMETMGGMHGNMPKPEPGK